MEHLELMQEATDRFNAGDLEGFAELIAPSAVIHPDPSWPDQGPHEGREAVLRFVGEWIADWESVRLEVDGMEERDGWVVSRCRWLTEGKVSGIAQDVSFTFLVRPEGGRIATIRAFFDYGEALRSLD